MASEPQLFALDGSGDHAGIARSTVEPLKLTAHTVPALQTLPDTVPPIASSSASSPRQPDSAPAAPPSALAPQHPKLSQRPKSMSAAQGNSPLDHGTVSKIAEAVHKEDSAILDGLVMPSVGSQKQLSTTSLSTIAESSSDVGNSQADLAALDQVAERLCELNAAASMQSDASDSRTDRSSFEFDRSNANLCASSPAQVSGFPRSGSFGAALARQSVSLDSTSQPESAQSQCESAAFGSEVSVLDHSNKVEQANDSSGEARSSSVPFVDDIHNSATASDLSRQTAPVPHGRDSSPTAPQRSFSIKDSAFFAPAALKPRTVSQELSHGSDLKASGRKLQHISSDSEILIHVSPGQGHETPFTSGPFTIKGADPCPTLPSSPGAAISARAAAAAAAAAALNGEQPRGSSEGLPPRPFSPPAMPTVAEAPSEQTLDLELEQRNSSLSSLSPTSRAAADVGIFSPRRLPPKLTNTRISGLGDGPRLSGDLSQGSGDRFRLSGDKPPIPGDLSGRPSSERSRFSGDKPRLSRDGPPIVRKPLFRVSAQCLSAAPAHLCSLPLLHSWTQGLRTAYAHVAVAGRIFAACLKHSAAPSLVNARNMSCRVLLGCSSSCTYPVASPTVTVVVHAG